MAKKKTSSTKTSSKIQATSKRKPRVASRSVKSTVLKMSMEADPFSLGPHGSATENTVAFASELGRRGRETLGLGSGPISTSIVNSTVARRRSRHAVLTNPYAKRSIDVIVSNVVGSGHRLISLAPDKEFKKQLEDLWEEQCNFFDPTGKLNFAALESLAFRSMLEGGDSFVRFRVRRPEDNLPVPLQLQIYESEQVPVHKNEMKGLNAIIAGIEFGAFGQILFYHMHRNHPGEFSLMQNMSGPSMDTVAVPASEIIHLHDIRRPNEVRGLPVLAQCLIVLSDLERYLDAELVRKKAAALIGGFIRRPADGTDSADPFFTEDGEDDPSNEEVHIENMEPGTFPILPPGYEVSFSDPADVGSNFKEFLRQQLLLIAASLNITYEQLTGDMTGVNDRTIRAAMLEFKRIAQQYQENILVFQFCRRVFDKFFDLAVISGKLTIPDGMSLTQAKKVRWIADPWPYMNPLQEINTQIAEVRAGFKSRSEVITQRGGIPEDVDDQIRADRDREEDKDLIFTTNPGALSNAGVVHSQDPTDINFEEDADETEKETKPVKQNGFAEEDDG